MNEISSQHCVFTYDGGTKIDFTDCTSTTIYATSTATDTVPIYRPILTADGLVVGGFLFVLIVVILLSWLT
jgi:hypothetical protein